MYNRIGNMRNRINPRSKKFKIILIVAILIVVVGVVIYYINKRRWDNTNPIFFKQSIAMNKRTIIPSRKIYKSTTGNSFTYFFWLYVDNLKYRYGSIKSVFSKGQPGYYAEDQCPGIYISPKSNSLEFILSTESDTQTVKESVTLHDFPMRKWFSIGLVVKNNSSSIFLDGKLAKSTPFGGSVLQNDGNLVIGSGNTFSTNPVKKTTNLQKICKKAGLTDGGSDGKSGFSGMLSSLCYFPEGKSVDFIEIKHSRGPYTSSLPVRIFKKLTGWQPKLKIDTDGGEEEQ